MIKIFLMTLMIVPSFGHAIGPNFSTTDTGNPFVAEERKMLLPPLVTGMPLPPLPNPIDHSPEEFYDKNKGTFDNLRVASKTDSYALIVTVTLNPTGGNQKNWLVRNGDELIINGRKIKVKFSNSGSISLSSGQGDMVWLSDMDPPMIRQQPLPIQESAIIPISAGAGIGAKSGVSNGNTPSTNSSISPSGTTGTNGLR